jgi:hypothetical protein
MCFYRVSRHVAIINTNNVFIKGCKPFQACPFVMGVGPSNLSCRLSVKCAFIVSINDTAVLLTGIDLHDWQRKIFEETFVRRTQQSERNEFLVRNCVCGRRRSLDWLLQCRLVERKTLQRSQIKNYVELPLVSTTVFHTHSLLLSNPVFPQTTLR